MNLDARTLVVAVIWTYNRWELAADCVAAVLAQTRPPDRVIVVDSASPDSTGSRLGDAFPGVEVIVLGDNAGPGAAITAAFLSVQDEAVDYFWLVEDDSMPSTECLQMALDKAALIDNFGILGPVGCTIKRGQWYATDELSPGGTRVVDFVVLDGALVSGHAVQKSGHPMTNYFIMMVDVEYPLRLARNGFAMVQVGLPYEQLRLGAAASDHSWRHYYQTRNHLRMALDLRSPRLMMGFVLRSSKHLVVALAHRDWVALRYRSRGLIDGVRGRMGRTVEPGG